MPGLAVDLRLQLHDGSVALLAPGEVSSTDDLARYLQVPKKTVYAWNSAGTGPRLVRIGKYVRYRREDVQAWLAERAGAC